MKKTYKRDFYTFGELLYLSRTRKGLSRKEISELFNKEKILEKDVSLKGVISYNKITEKTIHKWEKDLKYPDIDILYKLAQYIDADPTQLLRAKQYVQKHKIDSISMKIVGLICYMLDTTSNYVGFYYKIVSNVIQITIVLLFGRMMVLFFTGQ